MSLPGKWPVTIRNDDVGLLEEALTAVMVAVHEVALADVEVAVVAVEEVATLERGEAQAARDAGVRIFVWR